MNICYTRHGHNMFDISSMIQKALRRSDADSAFYAANEMIIEYRSYLWKRLLTVSLEDCHDMVTSDIYKLREKDMAYKNSDKYVSKAVSILLQARKNRDADYFACNYQNSWNKIELFKYCEKLDEYPEFLTRNGHSAYDVRDFLISAIENLDCKSAGYASRELITRYPNFFWRTLQEESINLRFQDLTEEIKYCKKAAEFNLRSLSAAKALVLLMKAIKLGNTSELKYELALYDVELSRYNNVRLEIPSYVYDCHTKIGKMRGKTKENFIVDEQASLKPFTKGWFDDSTWSKYLFLAKNGWDNPNTIEAPMPSNKALKELENGIIQQTLF